MVLGSGRINIHYTPHFSLSLNFLYPSSVSFFTPFFAALIGNTVIHLDKALARIREYERMKLKAEFNPCNASSAEVSCAEQPSANPAEPVEGTHSPEPARVHHAPTPATQSLSSTLLVKSAGFCNTIISVCPSVCRRCS